MISNRSMFVQALQLTEYPLKNSLKNLGTNTNFSGFARNFRPN
jgi:hypothetical protein